MDILIAFVSGMSGAFFVDALKQAAPLFRDRWKHRLVGKLDKAFPGWRDDVRSSRFERWLDANPGMRDKVNSLKYDDAAECLRAFYRM
jgi:hypothetical protein